MNRYQAIDKTPGYFVASILKFHNAFAKIVHGSSLFDAKQYMFSNSIPFRHTEANEIPLWLEIVIVTTSKDFITLTHCVDGALKTTTNFDKVTFAIYVPDIEILECETLFGHFGSDILQILPESVLISNKQIEQIRDRFRKRAGWVLQQCLKVKAVIESKADGVMIIDSDTVLTQSRNWLDKGGNQVLTPTIDRHPSFHKYLENNKIIESDMPEFPLVPHHTLMQPKYFVELLKRFFVDFDGLFRSLLGYDIAQDQSPFCIEYELYGQYMWRFHRDKVKLEKWGNIALNRNSFLDKNGNLEIPAKLKRKYASISFHDWQTWK